MKFKSPGEGFRLRRGPSLDIEEERYIPEINVDALVLRYKSDIEACPPENYQDIWLGHELLPSMPYTLDDFDDLVTVITKNSRDNSLKVMALLNFYPDRKEDIKQLFAETADFNRWNDSTTDLATMVDRGLQIVCLYPERAEEVKLRLETFRSQISSIIFPNMVIVHLGDQVDMLAKLVLLTGDTSFAKQFLKKAKKLIQLSLSVNIQQGGRYDCLKSLHSLRIICAEAPQLLPDGSIRIQKKGGVRGNSVPLPERSRL